jgi:hypothetical protein
MSSYALLHAWAGHLFRMSSLGATGSAGAVGFAFAADLLAGVAGGPP